MSESVASSGDQPERRHLLIHASVGVDGHFVWSNAAWLRILGWRKTDLNATQFIERVHPDDFDTVIAAIHFLHGGGQETTFTCRYRRRDGTYMWLFWSARMQPEQFMLDLTGTPLGDTV